MVDDGRENLDRPSSGSGTQSGCGLVPSSSGGYILPPKKIRDYAPVFPVTSAHRLSARW